MAKGQSEAKRQRAVHALDLRIAGASYRQIGKQLGISEKTAYYDVQDELGRLADISLKKAEDLRALELRRLDRAQMGLWPKVQAGDPSAVSAWVRLSDRRAKLLGLDAPTKTELAGPDGGAFTLLLDARHQLEGRLARLGAAGHQAKLP